MRYRFQKSKRTPSVFPSPVRRKRLQWEGRTALRSEKTTDFYPLRDSEPFCVRADRKEGWFHAFFRTGKLFFGRLFEKRQATRPEGHRTIPMLLGAFCGTLTVTLLSLSTVLLFLSAPHRRSYTLVTVPDFLGQNPFSVLEEDSPFNLVIHYETNPELPPGVVISQSPHGGATRRLYQKGERLNITLNVSQAVESALLDSLTGLSERDAVLQLQNQGLSARIVTEYSDQPTDTVLRSDPPSGTLVRPDETVTLVVSRGNRPRRSYVPELEGFNESEARERLHRSGLSVGRIFYQTSPRSPGTVLAQQYAAYTMAEADTTVDLTVSLGERYEIRTVPDLYGMNSEAAERKLKEYGLTVGTCHAIPNAAPQGTVITQSPLPNTPITSATYAVDLYVSS